jgi:hypothetical protein
MTLEKLLMKSRRKYRVYLTYLLLLLVVVFYFQRPSLPRKSRTEDIFSKATSKQRSLCNANYSRLFEPLYATLNYHMAKGKITREQLDNVECKTFTVKILDNKVFYSPKTNFTSEKLWNF